MAGTKFNELVKSLAENIVYKAGGKEYIDKIKISEIKTAAVIAAAAE
jgi:hypothetical protein